MFPGRVSSGGETDSENPFIVSGTPADASSTPPGRDQHVEFVYTGMYMYVQSNCLYRPQSGQKVVCNHSFTHTISVRTESRIVHRELQCYCIIIEQPASRGHICTSNQCLST